MSTFQTALAALLSDHQSKTPEAIRVAAARRTQTVADMRVCLRTLDIRTPGHLRVVHVAGTKGKGSTSVMAEAILRRRYGLRTGLFTSPHLVDIRERIRIGGAPVSKDVFGEAYWNLRRKLDAKGASLPGYFRMLTLLAFYIFSNYDPALDVLILEVGLGGRYDATNVLDTEVYRTVNGVTLLDFDHVRVLGNTIESIAWEKGGIFQVRKGIDVSSRPTEGATVEVPAAYSTTSRTYYTLASNIPSAVSVLQRCAALDGNGGSLELIEPLDTMEWEIGLPGDHQLHNAALAIALCRAIADPKDHDNGKMSMKEALHEVTWPGRCQTVAEPAECPGVTLRLDGAHTVQSVQVGLCWFRKVQDPDKKRVLCFSCSHERDPVELLQVLRWGDFSVAFFCWADSTRPSAEKKPSARDMLLKNGIDFCEDQLQDRLPESEIATWQQSLAAVWKHIAPGTEVHVNVSARSALEIISALHTPCEVYVTGSLYLVGSFLTALDWAEESATGALAVALEKA